MCFLMCCIGNRGREFGSITQGKIRWMEISITNSILVVLACTLQHVFCFLLLSRKYFQLDIWPEYSVIKCIANRLPSRSPQSDWPRSLLTMEAIAITSNKWLFLWGYCFPFVKCLSTFQVSVCLDVVGHRLQSLLWISVHVDILEDREHNYGIILYVGGSWFTGHIRLKRERERLTSGRSLCVFTASMLRNTDSTLQPSQGQSQQIRGTHTWHGRGKRKRWGHRVQRATDRCVVKTWGEGKPDWP